MATAIATKSAGAAKATGSAISAVRLVSGLIVTLSLSCPGLSRTGPAGLKGHYTATAISH